MATALDDETLVGLVQKRRPANEMGHLPRRVRKFYEQQNSLIDAYIEAVTVRASNALPPNARRRAPDEEQRPDYTSVTVVVDEAGAGAGEGGATQVELRESGTSPANRVEGDLESHATEATQRPQPDTSSDVTTQVGDSVAGTAETGGLSDRMFVNLSFLCNVGLFGLKMVFALTTNSVALLTSALDSALDLLSGFIVFWTARAIRRTDRYTFPQGKARLEPLAIIVFASVMGISALHIIMDATVDLVTGFVTGAGGDYLSGVTTNTYGALAIVVLVKGVLWALGRSLMLRSKSPTTEALASDHRNDTLSNFISAFALFAATSVTALWWLDAVCGVAMAAFIVYNWGQTGWGHVQQLTGLTAPRAVVNRLTFIAATHDPRITFVDTVRAYYFGSRVFAEVDIGLPEDMPLREAHDIGEALQHKLEMDEDVERAFVHIDYEYAHDPALEHS